MSDRPFPSSYLMRWAKCAHCDNLHLFLFNERDEVFAQATASRKMLTNMLDCIDLDEPVDLSALAASWTVARQ